MAIRINSSSLYGGVEAMQAYQQQNLRKTQEALLLEQRRETIRHELRQQLDANLNTATTLETNPLPATQRVNPVSAIDVNLGFANQILGTRINIFA